MKKDIRNRVAFTPDYAYETIRFHLLEKTDTKIKILETHVTENAPYTDSFEVWLMWEIISPDPLSYQVVFRKQYWVNWFSKPLVWKTIKKFIVEGLVDYNDLLPPFF